MEIFLATLPGLEETLAEETRERGFETPSVEPGGVSVRGEWHDVWRANLVLRCATRVLVRLGSFRAMHLAQLDKRARRFDWGSTLRPDVPVRIEATCRKSRIYHAGAAAQRVARAISEEFGAPIVAGADGSAGAQLDEADPLRLLVRIEDDLCSFSLDTSGPPLHRRGIKQAVGKAPLRETLAAAFLRQCNFTGTETVCDPMCGSGTFVLEAAEISQGLNPGRARSFAFERTASFDPSEWAAIKDPSDDEQGPGAKLIHMGSDRDAGAVRFATENAERAGVSAAAQFTCNDVRDFTPPPGPPGLVMVNPPYGARIGNKKLLYSVYASLGQRLLERCSGWRVGLVTSEDGLACATGLPFEPPAAPVPHGGLRVRLWRTGSIG